MLAILKTHLNKMIAISVMITLMAVQFISVHVHIAEEQHHHDGIHSHDIESHDHNWLSHYSVESFSVDYDDNQIVEIDSPVNLSKIQKVQANSFDIVAVVPQELFNLASIETSIVIDSLITVKPFESYQISPQPRAPPFSL
ncbi:MAG: hypothetical protein DSZ27_08335 [Thiomicrospira sp.]|nr:MAG: hypothetical protein DSZ27_08335 [Thiomicrospira sp.]